ncbi:MAG: hypothetical protein ACM3MG_09510 [Bacillota bacterium]
MVFKIIGSLIMIVAAVLAYQTIQDQSALKNIKTALKDKNQSECIQLTPAEQLVELIDDDFSSLEQQGLLPRQWKSIATVEYRISSDLARAILGKAKPGIQRVKKGTHYLEVEVLDLPDESNPGIILQASLFEIKSKNKIFEIGRTYTMNQLNRQSEEKNNPQAEARSPLPQSPTTNSAKPSQQSTK